MLNRFFKEVVPLPILGAIVGGVLDGCKFQAGETLEAVPKGTGFGMATLAWLIGERTDLPPTAMLYFAAFAWGVLASAGAQSLSARPKM